MKCHSRAGLVLAVLLGSMSAGILQAQDFQIMQKRRIDSLEQVVAARPIRRDTVRLSALNLLAQHHSTSRSDRAMELAREAWSLALALRRPRASAIALTTIGQLHHAARRHEQAMDSYRRAKLQADLSGDAVVRGQVERCIADHYLERERPKDALTHYERALALFKEAGHGNLQMYASYMIGTILLGMDSVDTAFPHLHRAVEISRHSTNAGHQLMMLQRVGAAYLKRGEQAHADTYLQESIAMSERLGNRRVLAMVLQLVGEAHKVNENTELAIGMFRRCLLLQEQLRDSAGMAATCMALGTLHADGASPDSALWFLERSRALHTALGDRHGLARTSNELTRIASRSMPGVKALEGYEDNLTVFQSLGDKRGEATTLRLIGEYSLLVGLHARALGAYRQSLAISSSLQDDDGSVDALNGIASTFFSMGHLSETRRTAEEAATRAEQHKYRRGLANAIHVLGMVSRATTSLDTARELHQRSFGLFRKLGDHGGMVRALLCLATIYGEHGESYKATQHFEYALQLARQTGNQHMCAEVQMQVSDALRESGRKFEALTELQQALALFEQLGDRPCIADVLGRIGTLYAHIRYFDNARDYIMRSMRMYEEMDLQPGLARQWQQLGFLHTEQQQYDAAYHCFNRSVEIARGLGDLRLEADAWTMAGIADDQAGRTDRADDALARSLALHEQLGTRESLPTSLIAEALLGSRRGNHRQALLFLDRARVIAEGMRNRRQLHDVHRTMAGVHERLGDTARALIHTRAYALVKDSLYAEENARQLRELTVRYETERHEATIRLLESEKELQALEIARAQDALRIADLIARDRAHELDVQRLKGLQDSAKLELANTQLHLSQVETQRKEQENRAERNRSESIEARRLADLNAMIGSVILIVLAAVVILGWFRRKQKVMEYRAREAEYQMQAAEMQALSVSLEAERREKQLQQQFSRQLLDIEEQNRSHIAHELHDGLGQSLIVVRNRALTGIRNVDNHDKALVQLQAISDVAAATLDELRNIVREIHPHQLHQLGLSGALRGMLQTISNACDIDFDIDIEDIDGSVAPEDEIAVYRIMQEAANNLVRHAHAQAASVRAWTDETDLHLDIRDDGTGFDVKVELATGFGLRGMRERVTMLGGVLHIDAGSRKGTRIHVVIPCREDHADDLHRLHIRHREEGVQQT
jgi:signal transduction histidine kinase/Tfp pilus assembly protein PilF